MGQGSGSFNNAPRIVNEESLALTGKRKDKEKKKKGGKKNLGMSKVKCFICHKEDTLPPSAQTGRRRTIPRWQDLQRWRSSAKTSTKTFV